MISDQRLESLCFISIVKVFTSVVSIFTCICCYFGLFGENHEVMRVHFCQHTQASGAGLI